MRFVTAAVTAVALMAWGASASAATCTATSTLSNPDATLTNSTSCGIGTLNEQNDNATLLGAILGNTFTQIDKDEAAGSGATGALRSTGTNPAGSSGSWAFDASTYSQYVIVIKDGSVGPAQGDRYYWAWFVVDLGAGCSASSALSGFNYCGTWTMYGEPNGQGVPTIKNISHLTLYGSGRRTDVPEPGTLALLGLGLIGLGVARRARKI